MQDTRLLQSNLSFIQLENPVILSTIHLLDDRVRKLSGLGGAADVAGAHFALFENIEHRVFNARGRVALADVTQHQNS